MTEEKTIVSSFIKTFECNRKLLPKPQRKLFAAVIAAIPTPIIGAVEALSASMNAFLYIYKSKGVDNFGKRRI